MNPLLAKLVSGRWILTVSCAGVFVWGATHGVLTGEAITGILVWVFKEYFDRHDRPAPEPAGAAQSQPPTPDTIRME